MNCLKWIEPLRPAMGLLASLLVLVGFKVVGQDFNILSWMCAITIFIVYSAIFVCNNYSDRDHDALEGNDLAANQPQKFLGFAVGCSAIALTSIVVLSYFSPKCGLLALAILVIGVLYSGTRRVLFVPQAIVGLCCAGNLLFSVLEGQSNRPVWLLFGATFLAILSRENVKDTKQVVIDRGYKITPANFFGVEQALIMARFELVLAVMLLLALPFETLPQSAFVAVVAGLGCLGFAAYLLLSQPSRAKKLFDGGMAIFLTSLLSISVVKIAFKQLWCLIGCVVIAPPDEDEAKPCFPSFCQPIRIVWPITISLLAAVIFGWRLMLGNGNPGHPLADAAMLTGLSMAWFMALYRTDQAGIEPCERTKTSGYRLVRRMSSGMALALLIMLAHCLVGIPMLIWMIGIPVYAILFDDRFCALLKDRSYQLGLFIGAGIVTGVVYASASLIIAYLIVEVVYYTHATIVGKSVWKPRWL